MSSVITVPPVSTAMSSNIALRRSPKPGALTAATFKIPRITFSTNVANASPSTSSAMMNNGLPDLATASNTGRSSRMLLIFLSVNKMYGSSNTTACLSGTLIKYGLRYPRSNCIPSTTSKLSCRPLPSSTVITPSLPTRSIASAISLPIVSSLFAEIEPTCAISLLVSHFLLILLNSSTAAVTALSIPLLRSIGFIPAATNFIPSLTIACANTVAVVVPSPALSAVLLATCLTICAPIFCNLSSSSISLATVTPSLVI